MTKKLEVFATSERVGHLQTHALEERVYLGDILRAGFGVAAALEAPELVALGPTRLGPAEHVQARQVPEVDGLLDALFRLAAARGHFGSAGGAEVDVAGFFLHHPRRVLQ